MVASGYGVNAMGVTGLQMVTGGYEWLQGITGVTCGYVWLRVVDRGYRWKEVVTCGYSRVAKTCRPCGPVSAIFSGRC